MTTTDTPVETITIYSVEFSHDDNDGYPTSRQIGDEFYADRADAQHVADLNNWDSLVSADTQDEAQAARNRGVLAEFDALAAAGLRNPAYRPDLRPGTYREYREKNPEYNVAEHDLITTTRTR